MPEFLDTVTRSPWAGDRLSYPGGYPVNRFRWYTVLAVVIWAGTGALLGYLSGAVFASNPLVGLPVAWAMAALIMVAAMVTRRRFTR